MSNINTNTSSSELDSNVPTRMVGQQVSLQKWEDNNSYETGYIPQGIISLDGYGMIYRITCAYDGIYNYITFDPNRCSLNNYGDPVICTRKETITFNFSISATEQAPAPNGMTHYLFTLKNPDYMGSPIFLMQTGPDPLAGQSYQGKLIFLDNLGAVSVALPMQHYSPSGAIPGLQYAVRNEPHHSRKSCLTVLRQIFFRI